MYRNWMSIINDVEIDEYKVNGSETDIDWSMLDHFRSVLLSKCRGLDEEQLKLRSAAPSSISLLGLLRHMSGVEIYWFARRFEGLNTKPIYSSRERPNDDFDDLESAPASEVVEHFLTTCAQSRAICAGRSLDDLAIREVNGTQFNLRWIVVHMIEEYARHCGHADIIRERIDGFVGN
jgi:xanthosine utilization system XapX-like protein